MICVAYSKMIQARCVRMPAEYQLDARLRCRHWLSPGVQDHLESITGVSKIKIIK